jgi:lysyl-tRNA synthetase class 1
VAVHSRAAQTASGVLPTTPRKLPFRTLASVVDITTGDEEQTLRILRDFDPEQPLRTLDEARPRLDCAVNWVNTHVEPEARTRVRSEPDRETLAALSGSDRQALKLLVDGLDEHWSLDGLTTLVYAVPKIQAGLEPDAKPTPELKVAQRSFFALLYKLLVGRDTGPRLPTLLLAVGAERVRLLLGA